MYAERAVGWMCVVSPQIADAWSSDDVIVEEGDDVTLVCNATGEPQPRVTWRRQATPTAVGLITEHQQAACRLSDMTTGRPASGRAT